MRREEAQEEDDAMFCFYPYLLKQSYMCTLF
jgi:hypothetical protein